jgi:hypothetical protein
MNNYNLNKKISSIYINENFKEKMNNLLHINNNNFGNYNKNIYNYNKKNNNFRNNLNAHFKLKKNNFNNSNNKFMNKKNDILLLLDSKFSNNNNFNININESNNTSSFKKLCNTNINKSQQIKKEITSLLNKNNFKEEFNIKNYKNRRQKSYLFSNNYNLYNNNLLNNNDLINNLYNNKRSISNEKMIKQKLGLNLY